MLFFDKSYSGALAVGDDGTNNGLGMVGETGKVACASCHGVGGEALDDQRSKPNNVSLGTDYGPRNAIGLVDSAFDPWMNWGGKFDSAWALPLGVAENAKLMNSTRLQVAHLLYTKYRTQYNAVFPVALDASLDPAAADASRFPPVGKPKAVGGVDGPWELMTDADRAIVNRIFANYGKALEAYTRTLISRNSAFDRFVAGDDTAISTSAIRGIGVFLHSGCVSCHSGPSFSDGGFHALAVPQTGLHVPATDTGRFADVPALLASPFNTLGAFSDNITTGKLDGLVSDPIQTGKFRTKGLRNVAVSGPYMHGGQLATLDAVVAFYAAGGGNVTGVTKDPLIVPLALTTQDSADLVAFLESLTGEPIAAALLADTSK